MKKCEMGDGSVMRVGRNEEGDEENGKRGLLLRQYGSESEGRGEEESHTPTPDGPRCSTRDYHSPLPSIQEGYGREKRLTVEGRGEAARRRC